MRERRRTRHEQGPVDIVREIKGKGLTQAEVDRINVAMSHFPAKNDPASQSIDPNDRLLITELERDEGRVLHAYQDSLGFLTIGIGRLIDKRKGGGITNEEADYLKLNDINKVKVGLERRLAWWRSLDAARQRVMMNLAFNLGADGLADKLPNTVALKCR